MRVLDTVHRHLDTAAQKWRQFVTYMRDIPEPVYDPTVRVKPDRSHLWVVGGIVAVFVIVQFLLAIGAYR